ncbi:hypothetical protein vseg_007537 [Gypsophila vaccaria]
MSNLHYRHIRDSPLCLLCQDSEETIVHALFDCATTRQVWSQVDPSMLAWVNLSTHFADILKELRASLNHEEFGTTLARIWAMWTIRNNMVFEEDHIQPSTVVVRFVRMISDYAKCMELSDKEETKITVPSSSAWSCPNEGFMKLNTDAVLFREGIVDLGGVIHDANGEIKTTMVRRVKARWEDPVMAEAVAILFGVQKANELMLTMLEVETENLVLVGRLTNRIVEQSPLSLVVEDILDCVRSFEVVSFSHVRRGGNAVAHWVARSEPPNGVDFVCTGSFTQSVNTLVELDLIN